MAKWYVQSLAKMSDPEQLKLNRLCAGCVGDDFLRAEIEKQGQDSLCYYCDEEGKTFSLLEIANRVEAAFERHYEPTPSDPDGFEYMMMKETDYEWEREGDLATDVIASAAGISETPLPKNLPDHAATLPAPAPMPWP